MNELYQYLIYQSKYGILFEGQHVANACVKASEKIDLRGHEGGHPRLGAVDLVPIHPLSPDVSLQECGDIAIGINDTAKYHIHDTCVKLQIMDSYLCM